MHACTWTQFSIIPVSVLSLYNSIFFFNRLIQVEFLVSFLERQLASHVQETALRCIHFLLRNNPGLKLYCSTSFEVPDGQTLEHSPSLYQAWKDDEIVDLNKLLSDSEVEYHV